MRNRSKIVWKNLAEEKPDRKGTYLVAFFEDKENHSNVLFPTFAEWHTAGDTIELHNPALQKEDSSGANGDFSKFMAHFGSCYPYEVKEDGFYHVGTNWDFIEGDKGEDGCIEYVENLGSDAYWADIPLMPEGYITTYEKDDVEDTEWAARDREIRDEKAEAMTQRLESDEFFKELFPIGRIFPDGISANVQVETSRYGVLYKLPSIKYASLLCQAADIATIVKAMVNKKLSFEQISDMPLKKRQETFAEIVTESGIKDTRTIRQAGYYFDTYKDRENIFFDGCRNDIRDKIGGGKENMPKVLAQAKGEANRVFLLYTLEKFLQFAVNEAAIPHVIIEGKFHEFAMAHTAALMSDYVVGIADKDEYAYNFNVDSEGNYAEYHLEEPDEDSTVVVDDSGEEDSEENEPIIGVDYPYFAVRLAPNHLMYEKADFAIRDNSTETFVTGEDGKILLFKEWEDAMKKRSELEASINK